MLKQKLKQIAIKIVEHLAFKLDILETSHQYKYDGLTTPELIITYKGSKSVVDINGTKINVDRIDHDVRLDDKYSELLKIQFDNDLEDNSRFYEALKRCFEYYALNPLIKKYNKNFIATFKPDRFYINNYVFRKDAYSNNSGEVTKLILDKENVILDMKPIGLIYTELEKVDTVLHKRGRDIAVKDFMFELVQIIENDLKRELNNEKI